MIQGSNGRGHEDSAADQKANHWGRNGGDPNRFRPQGLPKNYWTYKKEVTSQTEGPNSKQTYCT